MYIYVKKGSRTQPITCGVPVVLTLRGNSPTDSRRRKMLHSQHPLMIGLVDEAMSNRSR